MIIMKHVKSYGSSAYASLINYSFRYFSSSIRTSHYGREVKETHMHSKGLEKKVQINEILSKLLQKVKNGNGNKKEIEQSVTSLVPILKKNTILKSLNLIQINMLLTIVNKGNVKLSNYLWDSIISILNERMNDLKPDINNTTSLWINIFNILSNIAKNNEYIIKMIHRTNSLTENNKLSLSQSFVKRVMMNTTYNDKCVIISIREISILLNSCYHLRIKNETLFNFLFEKVSTNKYTYNYIDLKIFVHSVYKLNLLNFSGILEKLQSKIKFQLHCFLNSHLIDLLWSYQHFLTQKKKQLKEKYLENWESFISVLFARCIENLEFFQNKEFCNFLNFIIQNKYPLNKKDMEHVFYVIGKIGNGQNTLEINSMVDLDLLTIIQFMHKYDKNNEECKDKNIYSVINTGIVTLIKQNKMNRNFLVYILHFYKGRIFLEMETFLCFLKYIENKNLELKMKLLLISCLDVFLNTIPVGKKDELTLKEYYFSLLSHISEDISTCIMEETKGNNRKEKGKNEVCVKKKEANLPFIDLKEICILLKKRSYFVLRNMYSNIDAEIRKKEKELYRQLFEYSIMKMEYVELIHFFMMNKNITNEFMSKSEQLIKRALIDLEKQVVELEKNKQENIFLQKNSPYDLVTSLNSCNEFIFLKNGNYSEYIERKRILLKYMNTFSFLFNDWQCFTLYVHMVVFDINQNIMDFTDFLFNTLSTYLKKEKKFPLESILPYLVDLYGIAIKMDDSFHDTYLRSIYKFTCSTLMNITKLNFKYQSLLLYANILHLLLHLYDFTNYSFHIHLSVNLIETLFISFLFSLQEDQFNTLLNEFNDIKEYTTQRKQNVYVSPISAEDLLYMYRALTLLQFTYVYMYMKFQDLRQFLLFYQVLHFVIFKINQFKITDFIQTHKETSSNHNCVTQNLNTLLQNVKGIQIQNEHTIFPLFIIDILIQKC